MTDSLLSAGTVVGKYEVLGHIASGGMAEVYKARDPDLGRLVALKVLSQHLVDSETILERFRREALAAARLAHKNIVSVYEWGQHEGVHFLAMEYVEGTDLHNYICDKGRLDPQEAWIVTVQVARALDHACRQGVTHRDIKPSNILLSFRDGNKLVVKVTDLGLARAARQGDFRVTKDGTTVGTIDYMASEQARDSALADVRSDIYSLGCTLYHMLAGQPPFPEGGLGERVYNHLQAEVPDVRKFNRKVPAGMCEVLRKMLEKNPADRYQTPEELLRALLNLHQSDRSKTPAGRPTSPARSASADTPAPWRRPRATEPIEPAGPADHLDPRRAAAGQYERARVVLATDNQELAYAHQLLLSCCRLDPASIPYRKTLRQVGRALEQGRRWRRVLAPLRRLIGKAKIKIAETADEHLKVLEYGEEVLTLAPDDVSTHLAIAEAARALGLNKLGIWTLEELCKQDPENTDLLRILGRAYERDDEVDQALAIWNCVLRLVPYDLEAGRKVDKLSIHGTLRRGHLGR